MGEAAGQSKFLRDSKHAVHAKGPSQETGPDIVSTAGPDATQQIIMVEIDETEVGSSIWQTLWSVIWSCAAAFLLFWVGSMWWDWLCNQRAPDAALCMICTGILVISMLDLFVDSWYLLAFCAIGKGLWVCFLGVVVVSCVI